MPRRLETLEELAIDAVGEYIYTTVEELIDMNRKVSNEIFEPYFESYLKLLKQRFKLPLPSDVYHNVTENVLWIIGNLICGVRNETEKEIMSRFVEILMNAKWDRVCVVDWPQSVETVFWKNIDSMTRLEFIDFGSRNVYITDHLVSNLRKCLKLRKIRVGTTTEGYATLLLMLPNLEALMRAGFGALRWGYVLEFIQKSGRFTEPFRIKRIDRCCFTTEQFSLVGKMCPMISRLEVDIVYSKTDFSIVRALDHLTHMALRYFHFYEESVDKFLETCGSKITHLFLLHSWSVDLDAGMRISQFCPNVKYMDLFKIRGSDDNAFESSMEMHVPPFKHLEVLRIRHCIGIDKLIEFILSGSFGIRILALDPPTVMETTMMRVVAVNPMNKLTYLLIPSSMKTIIKILTHNNIELTVNEIK